ncbi:MAG: phosphotransferase family protein, partial [Kiloniellaceae bacterium]
MTPPLAERRFAEARDALEALLAPPLDACTVSIVEARPLSGGAIQENWLLIVETDGDDLAGRIELVLRTDAPTAVAASLSRLQEYAVLRAAFAAGVCVPEPLCACADESVLGAPFFVMRRVAGVAIGRRVVRDQTLGGNRTALAECLGTELARIHSVVPPRDDLDFLPAPTDDPARAAVARYRGYLDALGTPRPALEWGLRWCEVHAPSAGEVTLVHQDYRTGNYMVDGRGLTGILDWEFAAWGDPMSDIGWFCAKCWRFGNDALEAGGIAPRAPFYRGYERASGRVIEPGRVAFWEVMAHIRWAAIALQQGARVSGGEDSLDLALTGRVY